MTEFFSKMQNVPFADEFHFRSEAKVRKRFPAQQREYWSGRRSRKSQLMRQWWNNGRCRVQESGENGQVDVKLSARTCHLAVPIIEDVASCCEGNVPIHRRNALRTMSGGSPHRSEVLHHERTRRRFCGHGCGVSNVWNEVQIDGKREASCG